MRHNINPRLKLLLERKTVGIRTRIVTHLTRIGLSDTDTSEMYAKRTLQNRPAGQMLTSVCNALLS